MIKLFTISHRVVDEAKQSLRLALPLMASSFVQSLSSFASTIMLAHLSADALAAGALVNGIYMTMMVFVFGLLSAVGVLVAQNYGAKKPQNIAEVTVQGIYMALFAGIILSLLFLIAPDVLIYTGQNAHVIALAKPYLYASTYSIILFSILCAVEQFLIAIGKTKLVLWVSLAEMPMEILLCYALVFGKFGLPKLGMAGIAWGFSAVFVLTIFGYAILITKHKDCCVYKILANFGGLQWSWIKEMLHIGVPTGFMYIIEVAFWMVLALYMGRLGVASLAAHQITAQFSGASFMLLWGMFQAITVRVGNAVGREDRDGIFLATYVGQAIALSMALIIVSFYLFFAKVAISVDLNISLASNQQVVHLAVAFMTVMAFSQIGDALRSVAASALRGIKDTKVPMLISTAAFWLVGLPVGYFMAFNMHLGGAALWGGGVVAIAINGLILWPRFLKLARRKSFV